MRRLFIFRLGCFTAKSVPTRRSISKFRAKLGGMPLPRLIVIDLRKTAKRGFLRFEISTRYPNIIILIVSLFCIVPSYIFSAEWVDFLLSLTLVIFARISSHTPLKFLFMSALEYLNTFIPLSEKYVSLTLSFSAPSGK